VKNNANENRARNNGIGIKKPSVTGIRFKRTNVSRYITRPDIRIPQRKTSIKITSNKKNMSKPAKYSHMSWSKSGYYCILLEWFKHTEIVSRVTVMAAL